MTNSEAAVWLKSIKEKYIHGGDEGYDESRKEAIDKAISALQKSESRLLTVKEVIQAKYPTDIIAEPKKCGERVFAMTAPIPTEWYVEINKTIRFWTARPTDEQRKAAKWE